MIHYLFFAQGEMVAVSSDLGSEQSEEAAEIYLG